MIIEIPSQILDQIHDHGESTYPEEGAGLLLGKEDGNLRVVSAILILSNAREEGARHNRYMLSPQDLFHAELEADRLGVDVIGVFHSHPDHPNLPSEFDRHNAVPWYSYIITSVDNGCSIESRSWRMVDDREQFEEEKIKIVAG
ncbi:MAG: M67 family metallopeptidase [Anaerolineae bacterium]|nr:M67 family metallopeptidase [Anaerolineae bacterium]